VLHPLILAVVAVDLCALVLVASAAAISLRVVLRWRPGTASRGQLQLERRSEVASMLGRFAWWLAAAGSLLLVAAIAGVLPDLVPGAMCGTGVVNASDGAATRALVTRGLALAGLSTWHLLDRLDRSAPEAPLRPTVARVMLLATPLLVLALRDTWALFASLDPYRVVSCCAVVYDAAAPDGGLLGLDGLSLGSLGFASAGALLLVVAGLALRRRPSLAGVGALARGLALVTLLWVPLTTLVLVRILAPYHYEVLHHHCPWCLFLGEHGMVGYPLFAALLVVALEVPAAALAGAVARSRPDVAAAATARVRQAGLRLVVAVVVFAALAGGPALLWRLRFGVWMG
jgi:hypothetical protein